MTDLFTSGSIVTVLGAIGLLVTTVFTAWASFLAKRTVEKVKTVNDTQTAKLDNITILVDGKYGEVLQELANMQKLIALITGTVSDKDRANAAQVTANAQRERTASATEAIAAGEQVKLADLKT